MWPQVVIDLSTATICFLSSCYPVLVGVQTPKGEFELQQYTTDIHGYGGDILVFSESETAVFAIHRVIDVPGQNRPARIKSADTNDRVITAGCVNVSNDVYDALVDCCSASPLIIK